MFVAVIVSLLARKMLIRGIESGNNESKRVYLFSLSLSLLLLSSSSLLIDNGSVFHGNTDDGFSSKYNSNSSNESNAIVPTFQFYFASFH